MSIPHSRCNWLIENRVCIGARPIPETFQNIVNAGINIFVNLEEESSSNRWYESEVLSRPGILIYYFPIPTGRASSEADTILLINTLLIKYYENPKNVFYIHCNGGHGRSGMIGAILYGKIMNVQAGEAIQAIVKSRETRPDTSRNFVPTPETNNQVKLVGNILGVSSLCPLPDRTAKQWVKRVRNERTLEETPNEIRFYTDSGEYAMFSNFYIHKSGLICGGKQYPSAEHLYQSMKFIYPGASSASLEYAELIRLSNTPNIAFILANQKTGGGYPWRLKLNDDITKYLQFNVHIRPDWDVVKDMTMKEILRIKFNQDIHCKNILISTGDKHLIEHTTRDSYWGNGGNDTGLNRLGLLLMEVRDELKI